MAEVVRSAIDERRVVRITIARPERKNAFDAEVIAQLTKAVDAVPGDARCVVLASEGDTFCAGADLAWMRSMADFSREENLADSGALAELFAKLDDLEMPYVARKVGASFATAAFTTGIRFDSHRAFETGLVHSVVDEGQLDPEIGRFVDAIISGGPGSVNAAKRLVREVTGRTPAEVRDLTVRRIADARVGAEGQDGMRAF